jgi:hypothetical protein
MFSDFKSRGFGNAETNLRYPDRLGRLILGMPSRYMGGLDMHVGRRQNPLKKRGTAAEKAREEPTLVVRFPIA